LPLATTEASTFSNINLIRGHAREKARARVKKGCCAVKNLGDWGNEEKEMVGWISLLFIRAQN